MARKMKLKISARFMRKKNRRASYGIKKHCRFCGSLQVAAELDYKNSSLLKNFLTERGKILPSRISGNCAKHQRILTSAIKNARIMSLVAYTSPHY